MIKPFASLLLFSLISFFSLAQQQVKRCGSYEYYKQFSQSHPDYARAVESAFEDAKGRALQHNKTESTTIYRIPVVVHFVYNGAAQNLDDSLVHNQIDVLNEDYRRHNSDTIKTRNIFKPVAGDAGIEFVLASTDPSGNPTTGITRNTTTVSSFGDIFNFNKIEEVKYDSTGGVNAWDPNRYLNIWVCNLDVFGSPFILGFAHPPTGAPNWDTASLNTPFPQQGVVIAYQVFGRNNPNTSGLLSTSARGRTATHEVGHYLGLRHIWGDGGGFSGTNGCSVDDGISDTPNAKDAQQQTCDTTANTCTDSPVDFPDMIENYMDYSDDHCLNMFTQGQIGIMRSMLETSRHGLVSISETFVNNKSMIRVYPNPATNKVNISLSDELNGLKSIQITDALGRIVNQETNVANSNRNFSFDFSGKNGIYFVKTYTAKNTYINKLIVEN